MKDIDRELNRVFGEEYGWEGLIRQVAAHHSMRFSQSAILDDIVADVVSDIVMSARKEDGGLVQAIVRAKGEGFVKLKNVVKQATRFRTTLVRKKWEKLLRNDLQFSQVEGFDAPSRRDETAEWEFDQYKRDLAQELERMAAEGGKRAGRLRVALLMLPGRLAGKSLAELRAEFGVKSKATMQSILEDFEEAVHRLGERLGQESFIRAKSKRYNVSV